MKLRGVSAEGAKTTIGLKIAGVSAEGAKKPIGLEIAGGERRRREDYHRS